MSAERARQLLKEGARFAYGLAVLEENGTINVRTVSPTRRAAIVNWLCTERGMLATHIATDSSIEAAWVHHRGDAEAVPTLIVEDVEAKS